MSAVKIGFSGDFYWDIACHANCILICESNLNNYINYGILAKKLDKVIVCATISLPMRYQNFIDNIKKKFANFSIFITKFYSIYSINSLFSIIVTKILPRIFSWIIFC